MKIVAVRGIKKSGKTTTASHIIRELSDRGYAVGAIKHIHHPGFSMDDHPGTDTVVHMAAGAVGVTARASHETSLIFPKKLTLAQILSVYADMADWVVIEGGEDVNAPTVLTAWGLDDVATKWSDQVICLSGKIAAGLDSYQGLPAYDATTHVKGLVDYLEQQIT